MFYYCEKCRAYKLVLLKVQYQGIFFSFSILANGKCLSVKFQEEDFHYRSSAPRVIVGPRKRELSVQVHTFLNEILNI